MNDWKTIAFLARRSLMVFAAAIVIGLALYSASHFFKKSAQAELIQLQQLESANRTTFHEKKLDLDHLSASISRYSMLRKQGMVGIADREGWTEQLVSSYQSVGLPNLPIYTLHPPQAQVLRNGPPAGAETAPDATTGTPTGPSFHDLDIELANLQEEELLQFLSNYQAQVKGRFRVNACKLSTRTETGLTAFCTLRFFTLPDVAQPPAQQ